MDFVVQYKFGAYSAGVISDDDRTFEVQYYTGAEST